MYILEYIPGYIIVYIPGYIVQTRVHNSVILGNTIVYILVYISGYIPLLLYMPSRLG